jgi:hypothetical protein
MQGQSVPKPENGVTMADGSVDWSGGIDSIKVTTIQSGNNPNGLARNQLAWLDNGTVRDGGITQRNGWQYLGTIHDGSAIYQRGYLYDPPNANPYLVLSIGGQIYSVNSALPGQAPVVTNLSAAFGLTNPATQPKSYFTQGEQFLIIQAGDNVTKPLFWDGASLRRSKGINNTAVAPGTPGVNEIPAATAMDYYMGRLWYAQGRQYSAGDIVKGPSGTLAYRFSDSILEVTENPLVVGGDGFTVPDNAGNIRAIAHSANLDTSLGQGSLFIGTPKAWYQLTVPVTRAAWIAANNNNQPLQTVAQLVNGPVGDGSVVAVNGDLFYQSLEPGIRSLISATRYFQQWGNTSLSAQEQRLLQFNDRSLLHMSSGCVYSNRLLMTALPIQKPQGVVHQAIVPLDFIPLSSFGPTHQPVWEGMYEGADVMQLFSGDFGGLQRAFAIVLSRKDQSIQLWEITDYLRDDFNVGNETRTTWIIEWPAFTWGQEFLLKKLVAGELWVDRISGEVVFRMEYRPDGDPCWHDWHTWKICSARNSCEDVFNPICYPLTPFREGYRPPFTLPVPQQKCSLSSGRPVNVGTQFQPRLTIKGYCRIRGLLLHAEPVEQKLYHNNVCIPRS